MESGSVSEAAKGTGKKADGSVTVLTGTPQELAKLAEKHPTYTKVYANQEVIGQKIRVWLSHDEGETLYLLSSERYEDFNSYFVISSEESSTAVKKSVQPPASIPVAKRARQQSLFSMLKRE